MFDTVATRSPAISTGTDSGSSTSTNRRAGRKPIAVAAATTIAGTAASASAMERTSSATV
jgi:hypothetical protein